MLKLHFNKKLYRILSFFCAVLILFLLPCSKYLDASGIEKVYATGGELAAGGALAADTVMKFLIGLFGSFAAAEAYEQYKEEVNQSFYEYMSAPGRWGELIGDSAKNTCVKIYDKTSNTIREIPWDDMMQGLVDGHDSVVDSLTGLYAQYCPGLLKSFDDFITDLLNDEVYIPGFSAALQDTIFTDYDSIQNVDGTYNITGYYIQDDGPQYGVSSFIYSGTSLYRPFATLSKNTITQGVWIFQYISRNNYNSVNVPYKYYLDGVYKSSGTGSTIGSNYANSAGVNIPVFPSANDALAAFESDDFSSALNYSDTTMETVIDLTKVPDLAPDIPPFTKSWQRTQWGEVSDVIDFGGILVGDYADDLPFWDLDRVDELAQSIQDIFDKALEGIFEGTDVIEFPTTYDDVWDNVFDDVWDGVKDGALDIPVDDTGNPAVPRPYPWNPDIPTNPDTPANPGIDIPEDSVVDIPIEDIVPTVNDSFGTISGTLRYKFPFSIPWDIQYIFSKLADTPRAPVFELPLHIESFKIDETITVEMNRFQVLSDMSRTMFSMLFAIYLINLTFKVVGMRVVSSKL